MTNKQAKRRECLPRAVLQHRIYLRYIRPIDNARQQIGNRKQTLWKKNTVHWVKQTFQLEMHESKDLAKDFGRTAGS